MNAQEYIELRESRDGTVRRVQGGWQVTCPAHDDRTPSLHVSEGQDGRVLLCCHAGCETGDVLAADGLDWSDLFPDDSSRTGRTEVAAYDYVDEQGELLFQCVRFYPKDFRQRRPDRRGRWIWDLKGVRRVLYRLPRVIEAVKAGATVYVPEGEKDVHALERAGQVATCNPMGAGKWRREYATVLRGAGVIVIVDRDKEGREHARKVIESLRAVGASVQAVEAAVGKDAADHLRAGKTVEEFVPWSSARPGSEPDEENVEPTLGEIPAYPVDALPEAAQALVRYGELQGLPAALVGGAALAALAAAIGGAVTFELTDSWHARAILWVPLLAPRGAGKSPSLDLAFGPLREHDRQLGDEDDGKAVLLNDLTLEALARSLKVTEGAAALDVDELSVLLRGLGEYKRGGGGDRGRFLQLWNGDPWKFQRVGSRGTSKNGVSLRIPRTTLVVCGGLQPALHDLLGGDQDGLRPRWLPHLAAMPTLAAQNGNVTNAVKVLGDWRKLINRLLANRGRPTTRKPSAAAKEAFHSHQARWKKAAASNETASTTAALWKADVQLSRVAPVLFEADPGRRGQVEEDHVEQAARIVDFSLNCWRALPEHDGLALSFRDKAIDKAIVRMVAWLEERGGEAKLRDLQSACVAGVRTKDDWGALLERYKAMYPGAVTEGEPPPGGGRTPTIVRAPKRRGAL